MARRARLSIPSLPHIVQLLAAPGAQPLLPEHRRWRFLAWLVEGLQEFAVHLHAYSLLPDRVNLLLTPQDPAALSGLIQALARRTSRAVSDDAHRLESLPGADLAGASAAAPDGRLPEPRPPSPVWAGRFRSAVLEPAPWTLPAMVWVDTATQRAGMVSSGSGWAWSSAAVHCGAAQATGSTPALHLPQAYWALGNTPFEREAAYARLLETGLTTEQAMALERALRGGLVLGGSAFIADLEHSTGRRLRPGMRGRPRKTA